MSGQRTGSAGSATQDIYVGVADKDNTVYRSTDGGATWARIAGQPTGYLAHKGVLDCSGGPRGPRCSARSVMSGASGTPIPTRCPA
ncbi:hypothetical protein [Streptomyces laculatispora]|uniref:hypothetical protein n=1 Tax=Streptomyces laculatispora TaxID=887464 RepID=UPI003FD751A8